MNPLQMLGDFQKFQKEFQEQHKDMNPRSYIQNLLNAGKATPEQLEQARSMASMVGVKL